MRQCLKDLKFKVSVGFLVESPKFIAYQKELSQNAAAPFDKALLSLFYALRGRCILLPPIFFIS